jgi:hypothetical protein
MLSGLLVAVVPRFDLLNRTAAEGFQLCSRNVSSDASRGLPHHIERQDRIDPTPVVKTITRNAYDLGGLAEIGDRPQLGGVVLPFFRIKVDQAFHGPSVK